MTLFIGALIFVGLIIMCLGLIILALLFMPKLKPLPPHYDFYDFTDDSPVKRLEK